MAASCVVCHMGAVERGASLWPDSTACAACHDGTIQRRVVWRTPTARPHTNLRFDHVEHTAAAERRGAREPPACETCHQLQGSAWMSVGPLAAVRCLDCHGMHTAHLAAPDTACATCHLSLAQAGRLTTQEIAAFPRPPTHEQPGYAGAAGHGAAAQGAGANCATCHAREFCLECHVDAPERPAIQALASDVRSTAIHTTLAPPQTHRDPAFLEQHGAAAARAPETCTACHTRESCLICHNATPRVAARLPAAGAGRGVGAVIARRPPPSHGERYAERHAAAATSQPTTCAGCHSRADCLECHRPDVGRAAGYHRPGFLARHPAAAYARETTCGDCHNAAGFCMTCHAQAGLVAKGPLRAGYHDVTPFFSLGHGQAARLSLETCVSCHVEKDCLACHSALAGQHANPHGPGFDPAQLIKKNPQMCTVCHGTAIPPH